MRSAARAASSCDPLSAGRYPLIRLAFCAALLPAAAGAQPADDWIIVTIAGTAHVEDGGAATAAWLDAPVGLVLDADGNLFIADRDNHRIRRVDANGDISTVAGTGTAGFNGDGIAAAAAQLNSPAGLALDADGNLFIADIFNHRIRKIDTNGDISTVAGTGTAGFNGDGIAAAAAQLNNPRSMILDTAGNLFIADRDNHRIRRVDTNGDISTFAGTGTAGFSGDGAAATAAQLNSPTGLALDTAGNLFIADRNNHRIRRVDINGDISTFAGTGTAGFSGDGGAATAARLRTPRSVALDANGNLFIADRDNHRIRRVDINGDISTFAGAGRRGFNGDGGAAVDALLYRPAGVALDANGNLFIADTSNRRIRKVDTNGDISTFAGTGDGGDGGAAAAARLNQAQDVAPDANGNLFIADQNNHRIRKIDTNGGISTVAGTGTAGFDGDNKAATAAQLNRPTDAAPDADGNLFIADQNNHRIRRVDANGDISTVAGTGTAGFSGDGGAAVAAQLDSPTGVALDAAGNLFIADRDNHRIRKVGPPPVETEPPRQEPAVRARTLELSFVLPQDAAPAAQTVVLYAEDGGADFRLQPGQSWVAVEPASGSLAKDEETTITVTVDPAGLRVGTHEGRLYVRSGGRLTGRVRVVLQVLPPEGPAVSENGVVNAASLSAFGAPGPFGPQALPLAPGSLVAVLGENFTSDGESAAAEGFPLPASLGGATVRFEGLEAPLFAVGPQRIEAQLPSLLAQSLPPAQAEALEAGGVVAASVVVETAEGSSHERRFLTAAHAPGAFTVSGKGTGQAAALLAGSGALAAPRGHAAGSRPARAGDVVEIYATGLGPVYPPIADGENSCGPEGVCLADGSNMALRRTMERPRVSIGGVELAEEAVLFSGLAPALVGVNVVMVEVPAGLEPSDAAEVVLAVGGRTSRPGVTIALE